MLTQRTIKISSQTKHQSQYNSPLKVASYKLSFHVEQPNQTCKKYQRHKIITRRYVVSSPSRSRQPGIFKSPNRISAQFKKETPEAEDKKVDFKCFMPETDGFSPFLKDKITELRALLYRNTHNIKISKQHHINFSQLAIPIQKPKPAVLHSRKQRQCPLARTQQARKALSSAKQIRRANTSSNPFKSLEINTNSKYGYTVKMGISENTKNREINRIKNNLEQQLAERSLSQRRNRCRSSTLGRDRTDKYVNEYRPWQVTKAEQAESQHFQLQY